MDDERLLGIRTVDLADPEQAAQAALLASDEDLAAEHLAALRLTEQLRSLPVRRPPLRPPARSPSRGYLYGGALLAAAVSLFVLLPFGERDRAVSGGSLGAVQLSAVAEGRGGLRPLASGSLVAPDEWVVFQVQTEGAGTLTVTESFQGQTQRVYPRSGSWSVPAGSHFPGGASPLSWRPDDGVGTRRYVVRLCGRAPESGCTEDTMELRWSE